MDNENIELLRSRMIAVPLWFRALTFHLFRCHLEALRLGFLVETRVQDGPMFGRIPDTENWSFSRQIRGQTLVHDTSQGERYILDAQGVTMMDAVVWSQLSRVAEEDDDPIVSQTQMWLPGSMIFSALRELGAIGVVERIGLAEFRITDTYSSLISVYREVDEAGKVGELLKDWKPDDVSRAVWKDWVLAATSDPDFTTFDSVVEVLTASEFESICISAAQEAPSYRSAAAIRAVVDHGLLMAPEVMQRLLEAIEPVTDESSMAGMIASARSAFALDLHTDLATQQLILLGIHSQSNPFGFGDFGDALELDADLKAALEMAAEALSGVPGLADVAAALLDEAPMFSLGVVRRALRDSQSIPMIAPRLATIGEPWALAELEAAAADALPQMQKLFAQLLEDQGLELAAARTRKMGGDDGLEDPEGMAGAAHELLLKTLAESQERVDKVWGEPVRALLDGRRPYEPSSSEYVALVAGFEIIDGSNDL